MIFNFNIYYNVEEGQYICLNIVDETDKVSSYKMNTCGDGNWTYELRKDTKAITYLDYFYTLECKEELPLATIKAEKDNKSESEERNINNKEWLIRNEEKSIKNEERLIRDEERITKPQLIDKVLRKEWLSPKVPSHHIPLDQEGLNHYTTYDSWIDEPIDAALFSEAFTECLNKRLPSKPYQRPNPAVLRIKVFASQLKSNERLVLCGSHPVLGEWQPDRGIPCTEVSHNVWICDINTEYTANETLEYKFVAIEKKAPRIVKGVPISEAPCYSWETGYNRSVTVPRIRKGEIIEYFQRPAAFERPMPRMAGTIVDLERSIDSTQIRSVIDWMADTGQRWLCLDTRKLTRGDHLTELDELKQYALTQRIVLESKVTTHSQPLSEWWDNDTERAEDFYRNTLGRRDNVPHPIPSWLARDIMMRRLLEQDTMLCLFHYSDWQLLGGYHSLQKSINSLQKSNDTLQKSNVTEQKSNNSQQKRNDIQQKRDDIHSLTVRDDIREMLHQSKRTY